MAVTGAAVPGSLCHHRRVHREPARRPLSLWPRTHGRAGSPGSARPGSCLRSGPPYPPPGPGSPSGKGKAQRGRGRRRGPRRPPRSGSPSAPQEGQERVGAAAETRGRLEARRPRRPQARPGGRPAVREPSCVGPAPTFSFRPREIPLGARAAGSAPPAGPPGSARHAIPRPRP